MPQNIEFSYPVEDERYLIIKEKEQLKEKLKLDATSLSIPFRYFRVNLNKDKYLYAHCMKCSAALKYKKQDDTGVFKLFFFKNTHQHVMKKDETRFIQNYMRQLPLSMKVSSIMHLTTKTFGITKSKFYRIYRNLFGVSNFHQMLISFEEKRYESRMLPFPVSADNLPDTYLLSTPEWIQSFKTFGDFCSFDITYNVIKEFKLVDGRKQKWGLGLFLGQNNHHNTIPFALCAINSETKQSFKQLFKTFFSLMNKEPRSIISDQQHSIILALKELIEEQCWQGAHMLDSFHILKNVRKKTNNKLLIQILHDALIDPSPTIFQKRIQYAKIQAKKDEEVNVVENFLKHSRMSCASQVPSAPHGLSLSTSFHEKANDVIKSYIQYEQPLAYAIQKAVRIMNDLHKKGRQYKTCPIDLDSFLSSSYQLKRVQKITCEVVFKEICREYTASLSLQGSIEGEDYIFEEKFGQRNHVNLRGLFECTCTYKNRTGLPCKHLHKVIEQSRENLQKYIEQRWKLTIEPNKEKEIRTNRGRPKGSRRNLLK